MENSVQFLRLRDKYKSNLFEDSRLTKAADLAAQQELLLESDAPDTWKEPRLKFVNRQLRQWTKKIRQPGGTRILGRVDTDEEEDEDEDVYNLAVGPIQQSVGNIAKIQKGVKRAATPQKTSDVTQSPSSGKKSKFTPKSKRLLPKTPKKTSPKAWPKTAPPKVPQKTPKQLAKELPFADTVGESPWHSGGEKA